MHAALIGIIFAIHMHLLHMYLSEFTNLSGTYLILNDTYISTYNYIQLMYIVIIQTSRTSKDLPLPPTLSWFLVVLPND